MKVLLLDDIRNPKDVGYAAADCVIARTYNEAVEQFNTQKFDVLTLDHDLGTIKTGYDFLCYIEALAYLGNLEYLPKIVVHSANPVGKSRMLAAIDKINIVFQSK